MDGEFLRCLISEFEVKDNSNLTKAFHLQKSYFSSELQIEMQQSFLLFSLACKAVAAWGEEQCGIGCLHGFCLFLS